MVTLVHVSVPKVNRNSYRVIDVYQTLPKIATSSKVNPHTVHADFWLCEYYNGPAGADREFGSTHFLWIRIEWWFGWCFRDANSKPEDWGSPPPLRSLCLPLSLDWTGLDWIGLDWIGLDWIGLDWTGLDWIGLGRSIFEKLPKSKSSNF